MLEVGQAMAERKSSSEKECTHWGTPGVGSLRHITDFRYRRCDLGKLKLVILGRSCA